MRGSGPKVRKLRNEIEGKKWVWTHFMRGSGSKVRKLRNEIKGKFLQFYFMTILRPVVQTQRSHRYYDCSDERVWTPGYKVRKLRNEIEGKVFAILFYDYPETCCADSVQS
jgi:hypothetical protein